MPILVLDFDGTMTDAEAEGRPFRDGYLDDLCALVGRPAGDPEVRAIAEEVDAELMRAPETHPFLWMNRAVAPATVDPYLRMVPIANRILDRFDAIPSPTDRGRLLGSVLYKYNYAKTLSHPVFRAGAAEVLSALSGTQSWIVTNSDTHAVAGKVAALDREAPGVAWLTSRVRGHARKFDVDDSWDGAPATLALPGLARPVLLRRRHYYEILRTILDGAGAGFADLVVIGDIFELDLAMPLALGARVGLVSSGHTPGYERAFVADHPRGRVIEDLRDVPRFAFG
ncbi:MAG TPA: HAD hydrolase-like protein [Kofleriaceae bacterium]|jgi:FMN phosphatase YigB (HAD superfamily)|nr:HAD hydrolase-like protein [Kofleriaceae bacterium]